MGTLRIAAVLMLCTLSIQFVSCDNVAGDPLLQQNIDRIRRNYPDYQVRRRDFYLDIRCSQKITTSTAEKIAEMFFEGEKNAKGAEIVYLNFFIGDDFFIQVAKGGGRSHQPYY